MAGGVDVTELWADFHGPVTGAEPLAWGQRPVWRAHGTARDWWDIGRVLPLPGRAANDPPAVARAVAALLSRHESLRTRIDPAGGAPRQTPFASGRLPIAVTAVDDTSDVLTLDGAVDGTADPAAVATSTMDAMGRIRFDYTTEWPLRITLLTERGSVTHLALVFSHLAVDLHAAELLLRELRLLLLRGSIPTPPGPQSIEVARRERAVAQAHHTRTRDYWLRRYSALPTAVFEAAAETVRRLDADVVLDHVPQSPVMSSDAPSLSRHLLGAQDSARYPRALLVSSAADGAARVIAARHQVSTTTVLLAATAAVISSWTGLDRCPLFTMVNNRHRPGYATAIAPLAQIGLLEVALTGRPSFAELVRRTWRAALDAYRHAYYDPVAVDDALAHFGRDTATGLEPYCIVNDIRLAGAADAAVPPPGEPAVRTSLRHSTLTRLAPLDQLAWRFRLQILDTPGGLGLQLAADARCLPLARIERFLRELERLVVRAAFHDVPWPWTPDALTIP